MSSLDERTRAAIETVFGTHATIHAVTAVDQGRGVFSHVLRAELGVEPHSVAVKLVRSDANGAAAITSGAVARELLAYQEILPSTEGVAAPQFFGSSIDDRQLPSLVLQDLSGHRHADQVAGLTEDDLRAVTAELIALHAAWAGRPSLADLNVRRSTPAHLPMDGIQRGSEWLDSNWTEITAERRAALQALAVHHADVVQAFTDEGGATLCHGDPRGDNVAFEHDGRAVLFDWQQMAVQFGEADIAWLMATSVDRSTRRAAEGDIIASYAMARGQDAATTWRRYVIGTALPGLAVLFLAQRTTDDDRSKLLVRTSIERIADAVIDLRVDEAIRA